MKELSADMNTTRMEAFSDGVVAILITIMVLEMKVPHGTDWAALRPIVPVFLSYVMSFIYVGIYWSNHHHMLQMTHHTNGVILWANLHLLFWLSLIPFASGWMGENHFAPMTAAVYGIVLLGAAVAYFLLQSLIIRHQGANSKLKAAVGRDLKGKASVLLYAVAIGLSLVHEWISMAIYVFVAILWLVPDRRIERKIIEEA